MQNANKALMGSTASSHREVTNFQSVSGLVIEAGLACILESSEKISLTSANGALVGISLGAGLSGVANRTSVCRKGLRVPVKLKTGFDPVIGALLNIEDDTGLARAHTGSGDRYTQAVFSSGRIGGTGVTGGIAEGAVDETATVGVAYVDFPGGL